MSTPTRDDIPRLLRYAAHCLQAGDVANADTCAELIVALAPDVVEGWVMLGLARVKHNEHEDAIAAFGEALKRRPSDVQCWVDLGETCLAVFRYEQAAAALRQAMLLDTDAKTPAGRRARVLAAKTMTRLKKATA